MRITNVKKTKLNCSNNEEVVLKTITFKDGIKTISIKMIKPQLIIKEIYPNDKLYEFLERFFVDFDNVYMNRNGVYNDSIMDMYDPYNKTITFCSEDFYYGLCPLKILQIKYLEDHIELKFEIKADDNKKTYISTLSNEIYFNSNGAYSIRKFETAYFFRFILKLAEGIIHINNNPNNYERKKVLFPRRLYDRLCM